MSRLSLFVVAVGTIWPSAGIACVTLVAPPLAFERSNWSELESMEVPADLNSAITQVQNLHATGHGDLNIDQYSITLDSMGQSAADFMSEVRGDLANVLFDGSAYQDFHAYDEHDDTLWTSEDATGAVMVFGLKDIAGVIPAEDGAVVVSCFDPTNFVFSTVQVGSMLTPWDPGLHPVSGNRGFGVRDNGDGSLTFFVKATDRVVDDGMFSLLGESFREKIFAQGHSVWVNMLENITDQFPERNPRDTAIYSERVPY